MNILIMNWIPLLYLKAGRKNGWIKNFGVRKMTKPVSLFEIVDHKYCKNCRQSTMWWNIEKWNIQLKNRKCIPSIEARSTKRGYESIVKYCFFIVWGFNRYMVECEWTVLLWIYRPYPVLIDTWWNVNDDFILHSCHITGFNRYMVECEYENSKRYSSQMIRVLIDTWWNVNPFSARSCAHSAIIVLIDTWWNVNCFSPICLHTR